MAETDQRLDHTGHYDTVPKVCDAVFGQEPRTLKGGTRAVLSPDGIQIACGDGDACEALKVWDLTNGQEPRTLNEHTCTITNVGFSPDGTWNVGGGIDMISMKVWDALSSRVLLSLPGHKGDITSECFSPNLNRHSYEDPQRKAAFFP